MATSSSVAPLRSGRLATPVPATGAGRGGRSALLVGTLSPADAGVSLPAGSARGCVDPGAGRLVVVTPGWIAVLGGAVVATTTGTVEGGLVVVVVALVVVVVARVVAVVALVVVVVALVVVVVARVVVVVGAVVVVVGAAVVVVVGAAVVVVVGATVVVVVVGAAVVVVVGGSVVVTGGAVVVVVGGSVVVLGGSVVSVEGGSVASEDGSGDESAEIDAAARAGGVSERGSPSASRPPTARLTRMRGGDGLDGMRSSPGTRALVA